MKANRINVFGGPEDVPRRTGGILMARMLTRSHSPEAQVETGEG